METELHPTPDSRKHWRATKAASHRASEMQQNSAAGLTKWPDLALRVSLL